MLKLKRLVKRAEAAAVFLSGAPQAVLDNLQALRSREQRLVVLDEIFPLLLSPFRIAEFNQYLEQWPQAVVHSVGQRSILDRTRGFSAVLEEYERVYPAHARRVRRYNRLRRLAGMSVYTLFLNNAYRFLRIIDRDKTPFAFTLYPAGGFRLENAESDEMLKRVFGSPNFRKVITTQRITRDYLETGGFCDKSQIEFVYGGVYPADHLIENQLPKRRFPTEKNTFDICFVAYKYRPRGVDKGYDVFVDVAELLCKRFPDVRLHVVGPYGPDDIDVRGLGDRITFYGSRRTEFFPSFYADMDLILSPNVPFTWPGVFDGFPTGACMEAGMSGVAVFCTDELKLNIVFKDGEDIVIVPRAAGQIAEIIAAFHEDPERLARLGQAGQLAFRRAFDLRTQMTPRLRVLSELSGLPLERSAPQAYSTG